MNSAQMGTLFFVVWEMDRLLKLMLLLNNSEQSDNMNRLFVMYFGVLT